MSSRNPLHIFRRLVISAANRAYHVKGMRNTEEIAKYVQKENKHILSPKMHEQLEIASIKDLIGNRFERLLDEGETLDFFRDLDHQITFGHGAKQYQRELGDLDHEHALKFRQRKHAHMQKMEQALKEFDRVWLCIGPLLKAHPVML